MFTRATRTHDTSNGLNGFPVEEPPSRVLRLLVTFVLYVISSFAIGVNVMGQRR